VPWTPKADRAALDAAIMASALARMSPAARAEITSRGTRLRLSSKTYFVHYGEAPRCALVVDGLLRTVRTSRDGRDLTMHWGRVGQIMGITTAVIGPAPTSIQAVTDAVLFELSGTQIRELAMTDPTVGWAVAEIATALLRRCIDEVLLYAYGDLRTRIERRLLEFACKDPPGTPLFAQLTQGDLAEAVGAARPSVARVLKELRDEGSIRSLYGGVMIVRPEALAQESPSEVA
jgi:CRP/FNR family cyclic AMP-dependent transcriptional regulator